MWLNKRYPCLYFSTTTIWHLSMDKDTFMEAVKSSIKCQWIQKDSFPSMHWIIVLTMAPAVDCKSAWTSLGHSLEAPEKHYLKQPWQMLEQSWKFRFFETSVWHNVEGNKDEFGHMQEGKRQYLCFTHIVPLTGQHSSVPRSPLGSWLRGKGESMSECLASSAVWEVSKEAYLSLTSFRVPSNVLHDCGAEGSWESGNSGFSEDIKGKGSTNCIADSIRSPSMSHLGCLACDLLTVPRALSVLCITHPHPHTPNL